MIRTLTIAALLTIAAPAGTHSTLPPIPVNVVCTAPTLGRPALCSVEFWGPLSGISIATRNQAEAEELAALLIENSGRAYVYETGLTAARRKARAR